MQTSGTAPCLSDGTRKQITTAVPKRTPDPPAKAPSGHRRGGHAKHGKGGK